MKKEIKKVIYNKLHKDKKIKSKEIR